MASPKQITIRGPSEELTRRLKALSEARGESLNATVLRVLETALGVNERRARLAAWATWTEEDAHEFEEALSAQRRIDDDLWR
jgi:hypothetical protein